ncbi:MAG TPA: flagellin [Terriglobales bacterium]|nr:flagellin [Terriglobales bacterium]
MLSISTYGLFNTVLSNAKDIQKQEAQASIQESTGLVGTSFADFGDKSRQLLTLQNELTSAQAQSSNTSTASDRSQATYSALGNMITLLTTLKSSISAAMSGTSSSTLNSLGSTTMDDLASLANTQLNGRYLFAGSQTDQPAVDLTTYKTTTASATTADTSYYQGDSQLASVRISDTSSVTYGVTGDNSAIEEALRAAKLVSQATTSPVDTTALTDAFNLASSAISDLSNLQASVSVTSSRLTDAQNNQTSYISLLTDAASNIKDVDSAQAVAKVSQLNTQLQASYSALSTVMKIRLTDYL